MKNQLIWTTASTRCNKQQSSEFRALITAGEVNAHITVRAAAETL